MVSVDKIPEIESVLDEPPVVAAIESKLRSDQIGLFRKRLAENMMSIFWIYLLLSAEMKQEYLYWKAWKAAKFRQKEGCESENSDKEERESEQGSHTESDSDSDYENETKKSKLKFKNLQQQLLCSVIFGQQKKIVLHWPSHWSNETNKVEIKFLEHRQVQGRYIYARPKREDKCYVFKSAILKKVSFDGPPPFNLSKDKEADILKAVKSFKK